MGRILSGKPVADLIFDGCARRIAKLLSCGAGKPGLAMVLAGSNPASENYISRKRVACARVGIASELVRLPDEVSEELYLAEVERLNLDPCIHGILLQQPLPKQIRTGTAVRAVRPSKDVDGFHPDNLGALASGDGSALAACTPKGCMHLLGSAGVDPAGKRATVIGRSLIVGRPMAFMLINAGATVTVCNSSTPPGELLSACLSADILVAAAGHAKLVTGRMIKPGAAVLDVGINRDEHGRLCGDVDFASAGQVAGLITPVPGGVGPMTVAMLMANTVEAAEQVAKTEPCAA